MSLQTAKTSLPIQDASKLRSIHLLRALLREATYLPDVNARRFCRRYILDRFKAYQPVQNATSTAAIQTLERRTYGGGKRRTMPVIKNRTQQMQKAAQKGLNYLRRANNGELACLEKVMLYTYGRLGRRKYALLDELLQPDPTLAGEEGVDTGPAPLQKLYHSDKRYLQFFDEPKMTSENKNTMAISKRYSRLRTTITSQVTHGIALGPQLKRAKLIAPIRNAWERPMPIRRARNIVRNWYAETMTRLLPPLPAEEWDTIRATMAGEKKWPGRVPRRTSTIPSTMEPNEVEMGSIARIDDALYLAKPSRADKPGGKQRPHNITSRMMRRLYGKILGLSCKLEWDDQRTNWNARWGSLREARPAIYSAPVDAVLFEGVNVRGRVENPSTTSSHGNEIPRKTRV